MLPLIRLLHPPSGRTYHEYYAPPKTPMKDDVRFMENDIIVTSL